MIFSAQTLEEEAAEDVLASDEDDEDDDGPNLERDRRFLRSLEEKQAGKVSELPICFQMFSIAFENFCKHFYF